MIQPLQWPTPTDRAQGLADGCLALPCNHRASRLSGGLWLSGAPASQREGMEPQGPHVAMVGVGATLASLPQEGAGPGCSETWGNSTN